jgi:hypothetical protein
MTSRMMAGDPLKNEIELGLRPEESIRHRECFSFASGVEEVATKIEALTRADPV